LVSVRTKAHVKWLQAQVEHAGADISIEAGFPLGWDGTDRGGNPSRYFDLRHNHRHREVTHIFDELREHGYSGDHHTPAPRQHMVGIGAGHLRWDWELGHHDTQGVICEPYPKVIVVKFPPHLWRHYHWDDLHVHCPVGSSLVSVRSSAHVKWLQGQIIHQGGKVDIEAGWPLGYSYGRSGNHFDLHDESRDISHVFNYFGEHGYNRNNRNGHIVGIGWGNIWDNWELGNHATHGIICEWS